MKMGLDGLQNPGEPAMTRLTGNSLQGAAK